MRIAHSALTPMLAETVQESIADAQNRAAWPQPARAQQSQVDARPSGDSSWMAAMHLS